MDAKAAAEAEFVAARAEQERALAAVEQARQALEAARSELATAQSSQTSSEREMERAAEQLSTQFSALHVESEAVVVAASLVEYHANVGCYNCYISLRASDERVADAKAEVEALRLRVAFPVVELVQRVSSLTDGQERVVVVWQITIDRQVDAEQCSVASKADHLYVRLPLQEGAKQPLGGLSSFSRVAPEELETASYASVKCRECECELLGPVTDEAERFDKVQPLPSTNWMDMFDFWGSGIGAFEHIPRDGILARRHRIFVGEADIMLHRADLSASAVALVDVADRQHQGEDKQEEQWQTVVCGKCLSVLGLASADSPDTIRLHKHTLSTATLAASSPSDAFEQYTIDSVLSAKLLELADSDGIFRFRLAPLRDPASFVVPLPVIGPVPPPPPPHELQLLGWETMVQDHHSSAFRRVLKVLFAPASADPKAKPIGGNHSHSHGPSLPVHEVPLAPETLRILLKRLDKSSRLLPPSLQMFADKQVGYLFA